MLNDGVRPAIQQSVFRKIGKKKYNSRGRDGGVVVVVGCSCLHCGMQQGIEIPLGLMLLSLFDDDGLCLTQELRRRLRHLGGQTLTD